MESVLGRYRNLIILVGVLFLQVLGLAVQVKRSSGENESARLIRVWAVAAVTPLERGLVWIQSSTDGLWHNYFYLRGVRTENRRLKDELEQMRLEQVRLQQDAEQAHRLQSLLAFKEQFISKTVAAQVIGSSGSEQSRIVYIDKGRDDGLDRDMAVITADGIVGKVLQVFPTTSQVLLINDQSSGVGAILEKSRLQGVLRGTPAGEVLLERVMTDEQVAPGEKVLTSGGDQVFPKGLPVGTVTRVGQGKDLFLNIRIKPAANLSKLEEVLVVVEKEERSPSVETAARVRAADILAQRLPSVPEKPATDVNPLGAKPAGTAPGAKPQTSASAKPLAGTVAPKPGGMAPSVVGPIKPGRSGIGAANAGVSPPAQAVPVSGQPVVPETAAPALVQKPIASPGQEAAPAGAAAGTVDKNAIQSSPGSSSKSTVDQSKPADQSKPPDQSKPQTLPPPADDGPH